MKKLLLLIPIFIFSLSAQATHIVGGYFSYKCTASPGTYEITLKVYRDCRPGTANLGTSASVRIYSAAGQLVSTNTATRVSLISPLPIDSSACFQPPQNVCVEEHLYRFTTSLGPSVGGYYLTYQTCCRNNTISNLVNPGSQGVSYFGQIPNPATTPCNNSPDFKEYPPIAICENFPIKYDHSAADADGDSLVYSLCPAYQSTPNGPPPYNQVNYSGGFSKDSVMPSNPKISIDSSTGLLTGTPTTAGQYVVSICVKEYRNGVLIAEYHRDFQFNVTECTAAIYVEIPTSGIPGKSGYGTIQSCDDYIVNFGNISVNADSFFWDFGTGNPQDTSYKKTPTFTFPDTGTYIVTLIGNPGSICADTNYAEIVVYPLLIVDFGWDPLVCQGQPMCFYDSTTNLFGNITNWNWSFADGNKSTAQNPCHTYAFAGNFDVSLEILTSKGCRDTAIKTVTVNPAPQIYAGADKTICPGDTVQATPVYTGGIQLTWSPGSSLSDSNANQPKMFPVTTTTYTVLAENQFGCIAFDSVTIDVDPNPVVNAGVDVGICNGAGGQITANVSHPSGIANFFWNPTSNLNPTNSLTPTASPTSTQDYILTATSNTGCTWQDTMTVFVDSLVVNAGPDRQICLGDTAVLDGQANFQVNFQWTGNSVINPTSGLAGADPGASGFYTYILTGTGQGGCTEKDTMQVQVFDLPLVSAGPDRDICPGDMANLDGSGAVIYTWANAATLTCSNCEDPQAFPTSTTVYTITGTDINGCVNTDMVTVNVMPQPPLQVSAPVSICIGDTTTLNASGAANYAWTPANWISNTQSPTPDVWPTVSTTYTVIATGLNGCKDTNNIPVTVLQPIPVDAGPDQFVCNGQCANLSGSNVQTYTWQPGNLSGANQIVCPTASTTYTVYGTDVNGCESMDMMNVSVNQLPNITITADHDVCFGDSTVISANTASPSTYVWAGPNVVSPNQPTTWVKPSATSTYTVTITNNATGCSDDSTVTITVNPLPVANMAPATQICEGQLATIEVYNANMQYAWVGPNISNPSASATQAGPAATTTYTVTITDANGCQATGTQDVIVNPAPPVDAGADDAICINDNTQLGASGATSYVWDASRLGLDNYTVNNPISSATTTTTYVVEGTGPNGCKAKDSVVVTVNPLPIIAMTPDSDICFGEDIQLTATPTPGTVNWSPNVNLTCTVCPNPTASPIATQQYKAIVTSIPGCVDSGVVTITVNPLPIIVAGPDTTVCENETVNMTASGASTYVWTPNQYFGGANTGSAITSTPVASIIYTVTGTDANNCENTSTVDITVNPLPNVDAGIDRDICDGDTATVTVTGASTYAWINAPAGDLLNCATCPSQRIVPANTPTTYTVEGTSAAGCVNTDDVTVTVVPLPSLVLTPNTAICIGDNIQLNANSNSGTQFTWTPSTELSCGNCPDPLGTLTSTTAFTVSVRDQIGCETIDSMSVIVNPLPVVTISNDTQICDGTSAQLVASGGTSYQWNDGGSGTLDNSAIANPVASPLVTTTYIVTVTDANGCVSNDQTEVTVVLPANPNAGPDANLCPGESAPISASNGVTYQWSPSASLTCDDCPSPVATPTSTTTYTVDIIDANGCANSDVVNVVILPLPVVDAGTDVTIFKGLSTDLQATGAVSYVWTPDVSLTNSLIANPNAFPIDTTTYYVVGTDANGCQNYDSVTVNVVGILEVVVPNAFSPNGDNRNEIFRIMNDRNFVLEEFVVFNRWGEKLWAAEDVSDGWDGTYKGVPQPMDVYVYYVVAKDLKGFEHKKSGNVSLVR